MAENRTKVCGMSWCSNPIALLTIGTSRRINGIDVCRRCYQYVWEQAKARGRTMQEILTFPLVPPKRPLPKVRAVCARKNCGVVFKEGEGSEGARRHVGLLHVCRNCYETTWELAKAKGLMLEEAWKLLPPKGWKSPKPEPVRCMIPWCGKEVPVKKARWLNVDVHVCGNHALWLKGLAQKRFKNTRTWYELGLEAIKGNLLAPQTPEMCSMPWCNRVEITHSWGPKGEPICATDRTYIRLYAKRHNVTREEAFRIVPPPRSNGRPRA
jgi:hypothetical protein